MPPVEAASAADAVAVVSVAPAKATGKGKGALKMTAFKASLKAAMFGLRKGLCLAA